MPALTVVLMVHGRQAWVEPTVRSVLEGDVELVAVDDGSQDHGPEILDRLAAEDERIRVLHGADRNAALAAARGDRVWFLEPGDELTPGTLARVAEHAADLLMVDARTADRLGRTRKQRNDERSPAGLHALVLRRDRTPPFGNPLAVAWQALLTADRIEKARGATVIHRPWLDEPSDVFAAYDEAFAAVPPDRRRPLLAAMLRDGFTRLETVPDKREHFRRLAESYRRHRTADDELPKGRVWQARLALLERDGYRGYELLEEARRARKTASRVRGRWTEKTNKRSTERQYKSALAQPLDPNLAVYAAYWFRGYACNPRAIFEKARELAPHVHGVWVADAKAKLPPGVDTVVAGSREYYDVIARAGHLINNVNFPNHLVAREGAVHVQTHHGTPLKRMGLDLRDAPGAKLDFEGLLRRIARWDYSISQNAFSTLIWERVYPGAYESLEVGYPRNDALANATETDVRRIREELAIDPGQTAVLYAPTHREYHGSYVPVVDLEALADALGPDHVVLARLHYFYDSDPLLRELHRAGRIRDVAEHPSIEELCVAADVLVTDYSSLMFDYAVLDRPIVIHAPDWEPYRTLRGTYFDLPAEPPGLVSRTQDELIDAIASRAAWDAEPARLRAAFRERFCSLDDGRAAERVVRRLWP